MPSSKEPLLFHSDSFYGSLVQWPETFLLWVKKNPLHNLFDDHELKGLYGLIHLPAGCL